MCLYIKFINSVVFSFKCLMQVNQEEMLIAVINMVDAFV